MRNSLSKKSVNSEQSNQTFQTPSRQSALRERRLKDLETAFQEAANLIITDPLMKVFREKEETHIFMFERIQEIINEGMKEANNKYVNQVMIKMNKLSQYNQNLKNENFELKKINFSLQKKIDEIENNVNQSYQEKVVEFSAEMESFQLKFEKVCQEKKLLEDQLKQQSKDIEEIIQSLFDKEKSESQAVTAIKKIEEEREKLKYELEKKKSEVGYMNAKMEILEKEKDDFLEQFRIKEKEVKKVNFESAEVKNEMERKFKALEEEIEILRKNNEEMKEIIKDNTKIEDFKSKIKILENSEKVLKESNQELKHQYDDVEFLSNQLKQTVQNLKGELSEISMKLSLERKEKHQLEISSIELKDKNSELTLLNSNFSEELISLKQEVNLFFLSLNV